MARMASPYDWWPGPPTTSLPATVTPAARLLVRELRAQLTEWRLLADRTTDSQLRDALYRHLLAWEELLAEHLPDAAGAVDAAVGSGADARTGRVRCSARSPPRCVA